MYCNYRVAYTRTHTHTPGRIMSSQVQRLKAQLEAKKQGSSNVQTLLQGHHDKARSQKERERVQIETAKKMASRFNLTYRALALSSAKKAAELRLKDLEAAKEAKESAAKYQMTFRALQMSSTGTSTGRVNVLNIQSEATAGGAAVVVVEEHEAAPVVFHSLDSLASPAEPVVQPVVVAVVEVEPIAAERVASEATAMEDEEEAKDVVADLPVQPASSASANAYQARDDDTSSIIAVEVVKDEDLLSRISERSNDEDDEEPHDAFWLPDLSRALDLKDDAGINLAVIESFFQQFDPSRVGEAKELLQAHQGREEHLMEALIAQYPAPGVEFNELEAVVEAERLRPKSVNRVTGMRIKLDQSAPVVDLHPQGETGYILTAVKHHDKWEINSNAESEHTTLLRTRMLAKGYTAMVIDTVIGSESEML